MLLSSESRERRLREERMAKVAIVTGGARGIGLKITEKLSNEGVQVVAVGRRDKSEAELSLSEIKAPLCPYYVQADVSNEEDRERVLDETLRVFERVDILVNNAGVAPKERNEIIKMTPESWDYVLDTNMKSNMFMTQIVAKKMIENEVHDGVRGRIVNVSSCSAVVSSTNRAEYCVSKSGISMLTRLWADYLSKYSILVNEVRPGVIRTDMTKAVESKYEKLISEGVFPIARWGEAEDVAEAVWVFSSDALKYVTGSYLDVDGGFHIQRL